MAADLNAVFAKAFVEVLAPVYERLGELEAELEVLKAVAWTEPNITGDIKTFDDGPCGATPDAEPGVSWSWCDLPRGHGGAHNVGILE